jgi:hypothetical protein
MHSGGQLNPALVRGDFVWRVMNDDTNTLAFERAAAGGSLWVVLNRSQQVRTVTLPSLDARVRLEPLFSTAAESLADEPPPDSADGLWQVKLAPLSGRVFAVKR